MFPNAANRFNGTWSLLPKGHWDPLFHFPMIRPVLGDGIPWERGRPARILSLWPPLSFRAMLPAAILPAGTASARPKESHGAVPG